MDRVADVRWLRDAWVEPDGWEERLVLEVPAPASYSSSEEEERSEPFCLRREAVNNEIRLMTFHFASNLDGLSMRLYSNNLEGS